MNDKASKLGLWLRRGAAGLLSLMLVFSLIQPGLARADAAYICGKEAHTHSDDCYETKTQQKTVQVLKCSLAEAVSAASEEDAAPGYVHTHGESCYVGEELVCPLKEVEAHTHGDECYGKEPQCGLEEVAAHGHSDACQKELTCTEVHEHTEACYTAKECTLEETEGHTHSAECGYNLTCEKPVIVLHEHEEKCYAPMAADGEEKEPELICPSPEVIAHVHDENCYEEKTENVEVKSLTCTLEEHTHTDACVQKVEEKPEEEVEEKKPAWTCGKEAHTHAEGCYDAENTLTCTLDEHVHTEACLTTDMEESEPDNPEGEVIPEGGAGERLNYENWLRWKAENPYVEIVEVPENNEDTEKDSQVEPAAYKRVLRSAVRAASSAQIVYAGEENTYEDGKVKTRKTITGTDIENVFDITLNVDTTENVVNYTQDPDVAVVLVLDLSGSMWDQVSSSDTRLKITAAKKAAETFINSFAANVGKNGVSKIGAVGFNTDGKTLVELKPCDTNTAATNVYKTLVNKIGSEEPEKSVSFTNIEAGLKQAKAMLDQAQNKNKFIVFLSDGLPTTYCKTGTKGYVPYDGEDIVDEDIFYDYLSYPNDKEKATVLYGTSYSNQGAIKAAEAAKALKDAGVTIFSIGVSLKFDGTYKDYLTADKLIEDQLKRAKDTGKHEVCTLDIGKGITNIDQLEIFSTPGHASFEGWLQYDIGSGTGYYAQNSNTTTIEATFNQAFAKLKEVTQKNTAELWTVSDPVPSKIEFIGFFDKSGELKQTGTNLSGKLESGAEDTISYVNSTIKWDLQKSGYTKSGNTTSYSVKYRVRLKNELSDFTESDAGYATNGATALTYKTLTTTNGVSHYSDTKTASFSIPKVKGYLVDLEFIKQDQDAQPLEGAKFKLSHAATCTKCRGDESAVIVADQEAISGTDGTVKFTNIPSGHTYTLKEIQAPNGYAGTSETYTVVAAYDKVTVNAQNKMENVINQVLTAETTIAGTKTLRNHDAGEHTYTFEMIEVADQTGAPKEGAVAVRKTVTFNAETEGDSQKFQFDKLTYNGSELGKDSTSKTYYYKVSEVEKDSQSLDADETEYIVQVVVSLSEDKTKLEATQTIYKIGEAEAVNDISFTNTLLGELHVTKTIDFLNDAETFDQEFDIKVTITGNQIQDGLQYTLDGENKTLSGNARVLDFALKHGETAVIGKIPSGSSYTVEEAASSACGYGVTYDKAASGSISTKTEESPNIAVKVINKELADDLLIRGTKKILNPDRNKHTFVFQLTEVDKDGKAVTDGKRLTKAVDIKGESAEFSFDALTYKTSDLAGGTVDGNAKVKTFYYLVSETTQDDWKTLDADETEFIVEVTLTGKQGALKAEITDILENDVSKNAIEFQNTLLGSLTVKKSVVGGGNPSDSFKFRLKLDKAHDGTYLAEQNDVDTTLTIKNGLAEFWLRRNEEITIYGLPHGLEVEVYEFDAEEYRAYHKIDTSLTRKGQTANAQVSTDGTTVKYINYDIDSEWLPQTGQLKWPVLVLAALGIGLLGFGTLTRKRKRNGK